MEKIGKNAFLQRSVHGRAHRQVIVFLLFLSLCSPAWALAVASGSVSAKAVVDQEGRINAIEVTAILYHDDDSCWDYVFAQGDWATLEYYLDGVHQGGLYSFQVRFGPGEPYDSRGKLITIDKKLGNLSRGRHTASFQMVDWYGGLSCLRGNVIAEALVFVNAEGNGNNFEIVDEEANLGNACEQRSSMVGNPINAGTGNKFEEEEDTALSIQGASLSFRRYYNSRSTYSGALGYGWTHTYDVKLTREDDLHVRIRRADGASVSFFRDPDNRYHEMSGRPTFVEEQKCGGLTNGWTWDLLNGTMYHFDAVGRLLKIVQNQRQVILSYDAQGRLTGVIDPVSGRGLGLRYSGNFLTSVVDSGIPLPPFGIRINMDGTLPKGVRVIYGYDGRGNLTSVTYGDGSGFYYSYEDPHDGHNLTEKRDRMRHLLSSWNYDDQDRAVGNVSRTGGGLTIDYTGYNAAQVSDTYGRTRDLGFSVLKGRRLFKQGDVCSSCRNYAIRMDYSMDSRLSEVELSNGRIDRFEDLDSRGNAQTIIKAWGAPEEKIVTRTYHPRLNTVLSETVKSVLGSGDRVTIWDYDNDGNSVPNENPTLFPWRKIERGFTMDQSGNTVPYEYITTYAYNENGQILSVDGPRPGDQDKVTFTYYSNGDLNTITEPLLGATTFSNYDRAGRPGKIVDPNGRVTEYTYDARGRVAVKSTLSGSGTAVYKSYYNCAGELSREVDPEKRVTNYGYDNLYGRLATVIDPAGDSVEHEYDGEGNVIEKIYRRAGASQASYRVRYNFHHPDHPGRLWKVINPDETCTEYGYDQVGNVKWIRDANQGTTFYDYDLRGRLISVTQPEGVVTNYVYDSQDNLTRIIDANGNVTHYQYDDLGRIVIVQSPDTNTTIYAYDEAGNLTSKRDADGNTTAYDYDLLNRPTSVRYVDSKQDVSFTYDDGENGKGKLTGVIDQSGDYSYFYDELGNLLGEEKVIGGVAYRTQYAYDLSGTRKAVVYPRGTMLNYELDQAGRLTKLVMSREGADRPVAYDVEYVPFGPMDRLVYGNGASLRRNIDLRYLISGIQAAEDYHVDYEWDAAGNIKTISNLIHPQENQYFQYDNLYRLTRASGPYGTIEYTYDALSNRLSRTLGALVEEYFYAEDSNRLVGIFGSDSLSFSYDAKGNILSVDERAFTYDLTNRLVQVKDNDDILADYMYNSFGQRVMKSTADGGVVFHYDSDDHIIGESLKDGTFTAEYVYLGDIRLAMLDGLTGEVYFFVNNHLETPVLVTDSAGDIVWEGVYKPFGEVEMVTEAVTNNFRFPGQYFDKETGFHYNYHRYYDPTIGRYLTPDPIDLGGGRSLYVYVQNRPLNMIDPSGLWAGVDDLIFAGGGALVGLFGQGIGDLISGEWSNWEKYAAAAIGGAAGGEALLYTANPFVAGFVGGATTNLSAQFLEGAFEKRPSFSWASLAADTAIGTTTGFIPGTGRLLPGITSGRGSFIAVARQMHTKLMEGQIKRVGSRTAAKMMVGEFAEKGMLPGAGAAAAAGVPISRIVDECALD